MQNSSSLGSDITDLLGSGGMMGELIRQTDWSATPVGSPSQWETTLKNIVRVALNSPLPKCITWGEDYTQIYNDAYSQILGPKRHPAALGKSAKITLAHIWSQIGEGYQKVMQGETIIDREFKVAKTTDDGAERYFDFYKSPIWREDGTVGGILLTAVDVTEKVKASHELFKSRENLLLILRYAPVAMAVFNGPDYVVKIANDRALELWGKSVDEVMHKPILEGIPEIKNQGFEQIYEKVFNSGEPLFIKEILVHLPRGQKLQPLYLDLSYEPLKDHEDKVYGVISTGVDVTSSVLTRHQLEDAEERTRVALQAANMGTLDLQVETHHIVTSDRFDEIFGIPKSNNHDDYFAVIHPDDLDDREKTMQEAFATGKLFQQYRVIKKNGDTPWIQIQGKVYFDEAGKPVRILGTALDITEQKRLQQVKDDFISIASHELKTPLTSLNASLQLLSRKLKTDDKVVNAMLGQANSSLKKLTKLSSDLLDVSKIRTGKISLNKTSIHIADFAKACSPNLLRDSQQRLVISGDTNATIMADAVKIEQVLTNLIGNAAKYAPESKEIVVQIEDGAEVVKVSVIDKGPGIAQEMLPRLFDRYYQAESSPVQFSGLGLGLFIAAEIIKLHGGEIGVESKLGVGSTFWFTLPKEMAD